MVAVAEHKGENPVFQIPRVCPSCGSAVVRDKEAAVLRCENVSCPAQVLRNLIFVYQQPRRLGDRRYGHLRHYAVHQVRCFHCVHRYGRVHGRVPPLFRLPRKAVRTAQQRN